MTFPLRTPSRLAAVVLIAAMAPLAATETDDRIVAAAQGSYNFKTYLKDDKVNIVCKSGAVTLTGSVFDEFHRAIAEETLAGLPGVKSVNNQLNVLGEPNGITVDGSLKAKVQVALLFHRNLSAVSTQVFVDKGVVTLRGEAGSQAQKDLATEYVKGLDGVVRVVNEMTVVNDPHRKRKALRKKIDDASITAQVKMALLFNKATSAIHTKVRTENGIVVLTGTAQSRAEKNRVTRIVRNIEGVEGVRNQMTVETK
jgi:osmotically-inducible protein OsmY